MTAERFRELALSLENTIENPHFDHCAFKIQGKRIFATLHESTLSANFKFSPIDQSAFSSFDQSVVFPVPNKWGLQGWTTVELKNAPEDLVKDVLETAYLEAIKSKKTKP